MAPGDALPVCGAGVLIDSPRLTEADRRHWRILEATDAMTWRRDERRLRRALDDAVTCVCAFVRDDSRGYLGVSWGKDSIVVLAVVAMAVRERGLVLPAAWVRVEGRENPDCPAVRDAARAGFAAGVDYHEITVTAGDTGGEKLTSQRGFDEAARRWGARHVSGVRAAESHARRMRDVVHGTTSANTCAPLSRWSTADVYAVACGLGLPLHPAYAMTMGGLLDRQHLRVASLGGLRGTAMGRREWEWRYYRDELEALGIGSRAAVQ